MKPQIAVIGAGAWGLNIVNTLAKIDALRAVVDPNPAVREKIQAAHPKVKTFGMLDDAFWKDSSFQGVAIATPAPTHFDIASTALKNGKHVFVEKPMTSSLKEAEALVKLSQTTKLTLMTGHLLLYQPAVNFIKAAIAEGKIGTLYSLHQERMDLGRVRNTENVLWNLGVHDIAVLLHLCGSSPTEVSLQGQSVLNPKIEDDTYLHMKFPQGVQAHLHNSWLWPERRRRLVAIGSLGMLVYEEIEQRVYLHKKVIDAQLQMQDQGIECVFEGAAEPLKLEMEHFLNCIESGARALVWPQHRTGSHASFREGPPLSRTLNRAINRTMKLLIVSENFPPERNAPANRIYAHAKIWTAAKEQITVITCAPNFPAGKIFPGFHNWLYSRKNFEGIDLRRVWSFLWPNRGVFFRLIDFISFSKTASLAGLFVSFDLVMTTSPQFFVNFTGYFLSRIKRRPWVLEVRDLWPESVGSVGAIKQPWLLKPFECLELFFYRKAKLVVAVSEGIRDNLIRRGIPAEKIYLAPNGADLELFSGHRRLPKKAPSKISILYAGTLGAAHALDFILNTVKLFEREHSELAKKFHWKIVGEGAQRDDLLELTSMLNLQSLEILPAVDREALVDLYKEADWSLVNLKKSDTFLGVLPSKIFESSAMGIPTLLGVDGEAKKLIEKHQSGISFEPESAESLITALTKLAEIDTALYEKMSLGGQSLAKAYSREKIAHDLLKKLHSLY